MTQVSGTNIGRQARALAAALLLGTAVLGLTVALAAAESKGPKNNTVLCSIETDNADGSSHTDFYVPGEKVAMPGQGHYAECQDDGAWDYGGPIERAQDTRVNIPRNGGVYTP